MKAEELRGQILSLVEEYARQFHGPKPFVRGESAVPVSGKVYGGTEMSSLVDAALDFWLTSGRFDKSFVKSLRQFLGIPHILTTNSGSSANLLVTAALTSPLLGERMVRPGDEVITVAAGFPTTVNPLLLYGLIPVFVDVDIPTYNVRSDSLEAAVGPRTRAIMLAHTLGNPFDLDSVLRLVKKHNLWLIEDCCDALGSLYALPDPSLNLWPAKPGPHLTGTFGHISTLSFYPAHHITTGEGGAVFTRMGPLKRVLESLRDWGRDCYCDTGKDNTCGKRFGWCLGELPHGYDHKYIYSHLGFNLKMTDLQAAIGVAQIERLPGFIDQRKRNFRRLFEALRTLEKNLILPQATPHSDPAWFGFPLTVREHVYRLDLIRYLEERKIATRLLFGGNLTRQPYFKDRAYRIVGDLKNTDIVMDRTFWVGIHPGLDEAMIDYIAEVTADFFRDK
jgi:CDP-6-deoxy-D-xylo-4-hexulose-3-dehydrase